MAPSPPDVGPFTLLGPLGRGAMGAVWRARDRRTGQEVALKLAHVTLDEVRRERFLREGRIAAGLSHPGLVAIRDVGEVAAGQPGAGVPYVAYELVEGARTLDVALAGAPLRRRVELVRDAARALGAAHARGVVHRDVKPQNILVDGQGRVRVADFGLALAADLERLTRTGAMVGTPAYMAPEQARSDREAVGPATDVWALGVILYLALTDRLPFDGASLPELMGQLLAPAPTPPRQLAPDVPPELEAVVLSALSASAAARPRSGEAVAQVLDAWLASPGRRPRTRRRARRPLLLAGLGGGVLVALGVGGYVATRGPPAAVTASAGPVASAAVGPESARWPERDALIVRGRAALDAGRWDEAIEALEQARALREGVRLLVGLAQAYLGRGDAARGDVEVARRCADRALELAPDDLLGRLERAAAAARLGDRAAALADLERALVLDPRSIRAHTDRFELLVGPPGDPLGLPGTPQEVFDAADAWLAVEPNALGPRLGRAKAFVALGDPRRAADDMTRTIEELGPSAPLLCGRAGALAMAGDLQGAIADCTSALALDPDHIGSHVNRANCQLQLGRPTEALVDADAAVRLAPKDSVVRSNRSRMRLLARDAEGALADAEVALTLASDNASARYNRAMALQALGRIVEARAGLVGLTRSPRPDVAGEALVDVALIDAQAGGPRAACLELVDEAVRLLPRLARAWNLRAILRAQLGRGREALADHDKAIALAPGVPDFLGARAMTYETLGDPDAARRDYGAMLERLPPASPLRAEVEARLAKLEAR